MTDVDSRTRRFALIRLADVSGVSGTGHIADGCRFSDGSVVLRWRNACPSTSVWPDLASMITVHGHGGSTVVEWLDPANNAYAVPMMVPEIERWLNTAVKALATHRPVDGLCRVCGAAWPCVACQRAELALGSL